MKQNRNALVFSIAAVCLIGCLSVLLFMMGKTELQALKKPPFTPAGWLFSVLWIVMSIPMGAAVSLVLKAIAPPAEKRAAISLYIASLFFQFLWPFLFFASKQYLLALFWLIALWLLMYLTLHQFFRLSRPAGMLLISCLAWISFVSYLNLGIFLLNF